MIANYHTHTPRCGHADGTEAEYVGCALEAGLQTLGFSDHTPYPFPRGHRSTFRMSTAALSDYVEAVSAQRQQFAGKIEIHLGVEAEFYPQFFSDLVPMLQDAGIEYMLLGQHFLHNEVERIGSIGPTADEALLAQYCRQTMDAMQTGLFTYFAHPDLMDFVGDGKVYRAHIRRLCREAKDCDVPLEVNLLGIRQGRHYPNIRFWEAAAEENCPVILGIDAHSPRHLLHKASEAAAQDLIRTLGLRKLDTIALRPLK